MVDIETRSYGSRGQITLKYPYRSWRRDEHIVVTDPDLLDDFVDIIEILHADLDGFEVKNPRRGFIPVSVACAGKPYMAAYLYAVQTMSLPDVARALSVSERTVKQYLSDIKNRRRKP